MDNQDKKRFGQLLALLCEAYDKTLTTTKIEAYWLILADLSIEAVEQSVVAAMRQSKFFPTAAELLELAGVSGDGATYAAWEIAAKTISIGSYKSVSFEDPTINATIRSLGGWPNFVSRFDNAENEKWLRLEFAKTYSALSRIRLGDESTRPLAGLSEASVVNGQVVSPRVHQIGRDGRITHRLPTPPVLAIGNSGSLNMLPFKAMA